MVVTAGAGTTNWTVTRGAESTTAVSHNDGASVTHILTAGAMNQIIADDVQTGTTAALPANEKAGRLYLPNDGYYAYRDTGSAWSAWGPIWPLTLPVVANFSWVNQSTSTLETSRGAITIISPSSGNTEIHRSQVITLPSAPYTATMLISFAPSLTAFPTLAGPVLRDSGTSKMVCYQFRNDGVSSANGNLSLSIDKMTNSTTYSGSSYQTTITINTWAGLLFWCRIQDDNTNRIFSVSKDGYNFIQVHSIGRTDFLTPNQIGIDSNPVNAPCNITLLSYAVTQP